MYKYLHLFGSFQYKPRLKIKEINFKIVGISYYSIPNLQTLHFWGIYTYVHTQRNIIKSFTAHDFVIYICTSKSVIAA